MIDPLPPLTVTRRHLIEHGPAYRSRREAEDSVSLKGVVDIILCPQCYFFHVVRRDDFTTKENA